MNGTYVPSGSTEDGRTAVRRFLDTAADCTVCGVTRPGVRFVRFRADEGLVTVPILACPLCARTLGARHAMDWEVL